MWFFEISCLFRIPESIKIKILNGKHSLSIFIKLTFTDNIILTTSPQHVAVNVPVNSNDLYEQLNCNHLGATNND